MTNKSPTKLEARIAAATEVAKAAHAEGVDPRHSTFYTDVLRVTSIFVRKQLAGELSGDASYYDLATQIKFDNAKSAGMWVALVRRKWPALIFSEIPEIFTTPIERDSHLQSVSRPAPEPPTQTVASPFKPKPKITRMVREQVTLVTLITDIAYQAIAVGRMLSDNLSHAGVVNEVLETAGHGTFIDLKIKHSIHASEISQFFRDLSKHSSPWIVDAFLRDPDSFGEPPIQLVAEEFLPDAA